MITFPGVDAVHALLSVRRAARAVIEVNVVATFAGQEAARWSA